MAQKEKLGLHNLPAPQGAVKDPKRKGRGPGSGLGKTAGRGQNGQRSRSGGGVRPGFEGGQMPLIRRIPKRGFTNPYRVPAQVVNVVSLEKLDGDTVTPDSLVAARLVKKADRPIKILGSGEVKKAYVVRYCEISKTAREKIEKAGGRIEG